MLLLAQTASVGARKKYDMPGQKMDRPDENDQTAYSLSIFHTTNYTENCKSEMSARWLMERGMLKKEYAAQWCVVRNGASPHTGHPRCRLDTIHFASDANESS